MNYYCFITSFKLYHLANIGTISRLLLNRLFNIFSYKFKEIINIILQIIGRFIYSSFYLIMKANIKYRIEFNFVLLFITDPAALCDQSGLFKEKVRITVPSLKSSLVEEQFESVLNELTKSSKSKSREKADRTVNNRCNAQCNNILRLCSNIFAMTVPMISLRSHFNMSLVLLVMFYLICTTQSILVEDQNQNQNTPGIAEDHLKGISASAYNTNTNTNTNTSARSNGKSISSNATENGLSSIGSSVASSGYLGNLDNLERSLAAVLIKVAYGTTSTTKRSIPDNSYILGLTTVATPLLTTLR